MRYMCDFETTTQSDDCRVWATACVKIGTDNVVIHNNLDDYMEDLEGGSTYYFHNLKFDGDFILNWLFRHGYKWTLSRTPSEYEFHTQISSMNQFYSMVVNMHGKIIKFVDSLKIIPFSVDKIAKGWNLPMSKGSIEYSKYRPVGYKLTDEEEDYIKNDVLIVASALKTLFSQGLTSNTQGGNALRDYKKIIGGGKQFREGISNA